ncbi:hypothetical protein CR513_38627, partial [Mucuna pruriens]
LPRQKAIINARTLWMEFGDTFVQFNNFEALKHPAEDNSIFSIDTIDRLIEEHIQVGTGNANLFDFVEISSIINCFYTVEAIAYFESLYKIDEVPEETEIASVNLKGAEIISNSQLEVKSDSIQKESQKLEVESDFRQPCPYSDRVDQLTPSTAEQIIPPQSPTTELNMLIWRIANNLSREQEEKLLNVLQKHKKEIGWMLAGLLGINPCIYMHKILLEEEACPIIRQQRRLNPTILDVVKKEVTKLLAARIIYLILNSKWVSPILVVLKKSKMTVVKNQ